MSLLGNAPHYHFGCVIQKIDGSFQQQQQQRPNMDPEYYFRPRVAALASAQMEYAGTPVGSARGSLASHLDTIGVNSGAAAAVQRANQGGGGEPMIE